MVLVFILVVYCDQPESLTVLFLLSPIGSTVEGYFHLDIQHLSFQVLKDILKLLSPNIDAPASMSSVAFDN